LAHLLRFAMAVTNMTAERGLLVLGSSKAGGLLLEITLPSG